MFLFFFLLSAVFSNEVYLFLNVSDYWAQFVLFSSHQFTTFRFNSNINNIDFLQLHSNVRVYDNDNNINPHIVWFKINTVQPILYNIPINDLCIIRPFNIFENDNITFCKLIIDTSIIDVYINDSIFIEKYYGDHITLIKNNFNCLIITKSLATGRIKISLVTN